MHVMESEVYPSSHRAAMWNAQCFMAHGSAMVHPGGPEDVAEDPGTDAKLQDIHLDEAEGDEGESGPEAEEEEAAEPAAKHGWNEDEAQRDAMPEAGPQGLASQSAAAQVRLPPQRALAQCQEGRSVLHATDGGLHNITVWVMPAPLGMPMSEYVIVRRMCLLDCCLRRLSAQALSWWLG